MKLLIDFLPVAIFFIAYYLTKDMILATGVLIGASALQILLTWLKFRKFEKIQLITFGFLVILGGATIFLKDEQYLKLKPTAANWVLALIFIGSHLIVKKNLVQLMMSNNIQLPSIIWDRLNYSWVTFFLVLGAINLYVAYHFSTEIWVQFKLFGLLGLTLLFIVLQSLYLVRYIPRDLNSPPKS